MPKALPKNSQFSLTHFFGRFKLHWKLLFYMPGTKALLKSSLSLTQTPTHISQETTVPTHPVFFANSRKHRGGRTSPPSPHTKPLLVCLLLYSPSSFVATTTGGEDDAGGISPNRRNCVHSSTWASFAVADINMHLCAILCFLTHPRPS